MKPVTVLVSACGAPGTAALLRALRENGEREVRLVGTDMGERAVGKHLCDAFHLVPAGSDPAFPGAVTAVKSSTTALRTASSDARPAIRSKTARTFPKTLPASRGRRVLKVCGAAAPTPLLALMVKLYEPPVLAAGMPLRVAVPLPLFTKLMPAGKVDA